MSKLFYEISELKILISGDLDIKVTKSFIPFQKEYPESMADYIVECSEVEYIPEYIGTQVMKEREFCVYEDSGRQKRLYHNRRDNDKPYALTEFDLEHKRIQVSYLPEGRKCFAESGNSFFHIGWEKILACEQRILFHAACIDTEVGGIVFSGPSGIGKSTQADLWCNLEKAKLINGDRVIIRKKDFEWLAYGSPYAGSSGCYVNESCPLRAIVILKKASECRIRRLKGIEAFRKVYEGLTINSWDKEFVTRACDIAMEMISEIPVYELECLPDKSAVDILKNELEG